MRTTAEASFACLVVVMPVYLVGATSTFIREDLGLTASQLGLAFSTFMATSAVGHVVSGRLVGRIGAGRGMFIGSLGSGAVLLSVAAGVSTFAELCVALVVAGAFSSMSNQASNLALAECESERPAFMFGVKQASVPLATLLAGVSVPVISATAGWRWAFVAAGALALSASATFVRTVARRPRSMVTQRTPQVPTGAFLVLTIATGLGQGAATTTAAFFVATATSRGLSAGSAGWLLAVGSLAGIAIRLIVGWRSDDRPGGGFDLVAGMLVLGGVGYGLLAVAHGSVPLTVGVVAANGFGLGWMGLLLFSVVALRPDSPAAATGIVSSGAAVGAALTPAAFGWLAAHGSLTLAWMFAMAISMLSAALVLLAAQRLWPNTSSPLAATSAGVNATVDDVAGPL